MSTPRAPRRFDARPRRARAGLTTALLAALLVGCQSGGGASGGPSNGPGATDDGLGIASSRAPSASSVGGSPEVGTGGGTQGGAGSGPGDATLLENEFEQVVAAVSPSIVVIETSEGLGSGVIFDTQGDIVTNAHVVGTSTTFKVTTAAGNRYDATLVGKFVPDDLAVIKVSGGNLPAATFGDSSG